MSILYSYPPLEYNQNKYILLQEFFVLEEKFLKHVTSYFKLETTYIFDTSDSLM